VDEVGLETTDESSARVTARLKIAALAVLAPLLSVVLAGVSGRDDNYITYEAAKNLAAYGRLLNINGDKIEQSSSILHVLILGAFSFISRISLPWLGWGLSLIGGYFTALFVGFVAERLRAGSGWIATLICAGATPLLYWSASGLETTIASAILTALVLLSLDVVGTRPRSARRVSALLGIVALMAMIRPEGALVLILGFLTTAFIARLGARRFTPVGRSASYDLLLLALVASVCLALLVVFRLVYFGVPFPQPVLAKSEVSIARIGDGFIYFWNSTDLSVALIVTFACVGGWSLRRSQWVPLALIMSLVLALVGFAAFSGGDWMELGRFICLPLALLSVVAGVGLHSLRLASTHQLLPIALALSVVVLFTRSTFSGLSADSKGSPIWAEVTWTDPQVQTANGPWVETKNQPHRRDLPAAEALKEVIESLAAGGVRPVTVASVQAGLVVFNGFPSSFGVARFIDNAGLSTDDFMSCSPTPQRSAFGLEVDVRPWTAGKSVCGIKPPDVLLHFRIGDQPKPKDKYVVVFVQGGETSRGPMIGDVITGQWIAVRKDLQHLLP